VIYKQDMWDDDIQAHRVQRSPMQSAVVESVNTAIPLILEGPKSSILKDPKFDFGALKTFAYWKPTNGQGSTSQCLKEAFKAAWQQIRGAIDLFLGGSPVAWSVMNEMLAENKILTSQLFITEITLYYYEILSKTGGNPPHSKEVDALPGQGAEAVLQPLFWLAPTKILFAGADFLLTSSFRGVCGGFKNWFDTGDGHRPLTPFEFRAWPGTTFLPQPTPISNHGGGQRGFTKGG